MSGKASSSRGADPAQKAGPAKGKNSDDRCDLNFSVDLSAVDLSVLRTLSPGTILGVGLANVGNFEAVVCRNSAGEVVGTLAAFEGLAGLIDCIRRGYRYAATVVRINGAACTVHVRRVAK
jgi:hypothetical protein